MVTIPASQQCPLNELKETHESRNLDVAAREPVYTSLMQLAQFPLHIVKAIVTSCQYPSASVGLLQLLSIRDSRDEHVLWYIFPKCSPGRHLFPQHMVCMLVKMSRKWTTPKPMT